MTKSVRIDYSRQFLKQLRKAPLEIKIAFRRRFALFSTEPLHPLLNVHPLMGNFEGYYSINVTGDWRAIYSERQTEAGEIITVFEFLGTHSQLYR